MNPYGICHHTKYEGCPPCIHSAWEEGVRAAREAVERVSTLFEPLGPALAAIDALRGES